MALTTRLAARVRPSVRRLGLAAAIVGALLAAAVALSEVPPPRERLEGVGNRFGTGGLLGRFAPDRPLTFLVVGGDAVGLADALGRGVEAETEASICVLVGDLAPSSDPRGYDLLLERLASVPRRPPVFCVRGRHEAGPDGGKLFADRFGRRVFHIQYGGCLFLFLDNADGEVLQPQLAPFERLLELEAGRFRRVFAFVHRSTGPEGEPALSDFCRRHRVDVVIAGRADADGRQRRHGTEWISIGAKGATAIAFEISPSGELRERVVAHGVGRGAAARAACRWRVAWAPALAAHRGLAFALAACLLVGGASLWMRVPKD